MGYDSGDNVSEQYRNPGRFTGGTIQGVAFDVSERGLEHRTHGLS